jgi:localization factor PodJL
MPEQKQTPHSVLPNLIDPTANLAPAAGMISNEITGSITNNKPDPAVTGQVQVPAQPKAKQKQQASAQPAPPPADSELPASIGNPALRGAALAGDRNAMYEIADRYFTGRGVPSNPGEGIKWFIRAADKGSAIAAYRLGMIHEKGLGVQQDRRQARTYYVLAAESGHVRAMHNLAVIILEVPAGADGKPDYAAAIPWFRKAADHGLRDSQYNLGVLYARGLGVQQNLAESFRWFALAANQGDADAAKKRDDVAARLDHQTLVASRLAVQTWQMKPIDDSVNAAGLKPEWQKTAERPRKKDSKK